MPIYTPGKLVLAQTYVGIDDPDAAVYIAAVEAADGQALETATRVAIHSFVKGCKNDGIWPAIKASCILAGARTLTGALVPLVGTAPTNNNFVSGDYNRETGLVGDGTNKSLNSNRANNADPQNNQHLAAYRSGGGGGGYLVAVNPALGASALLIISSTETRIYSRALNNTNYSPITTLAFPTGVVGVSRSSSTGFTARLEGANYTTTTAGSNTPSAANLFVFSREDGSGNPAAFSANRLAFYSIGESLDLALLDARVTTLINAFAAAIP